MNLKLLFRNKSTKKKDFWKLSQDLLNQNPCYGALESAIYKALYDSDDHSGFEMTGQNCNWS